MILTSNWSVASDDEHSRQSFLSDCDSEFDLSPATQYLDESRSISALRKLSINRHEPLTTRSRAKATDRATLVSQSMPKERRRSTIRHSVDTFTGRAATLTNSILFPRQQSSDTQLPTSPTDGVNSLANWLESCSLDEMSNTCCRPRRESIGHCIRQINPFSSSKTVPDSNLFSPAQTSPFLAQTATAYFDQQQTQLWSRFRFAIPTIQDLRHSEPLHSPSSATFTFPINNYNNNNNSLSLPVHTLLTDTMSLSTAMFTSQQTAHSKPSPDKEGHPIEHSPSTIFFTLIIFAVGLVFGCLLTNTFPPNPILHWLLILWTHCAQVTVGYVHFLHVYLQPVLKNCSSFLLV